MFPGDLVKEQVGYKKEKMYVFRKSASTGVYIKTFFFLNRKDEPKVFVSCIVTAQYVYLLYETSHISVAQLPIPVEKKTFTSHCLLVKDMSTNSTQEVSLGQFSLKSIKTYSQKEKMHKYKYSEHVAIFNVQHRKKVPNQRHIVLRLRNTQAIILNVQRI